MEDELLVARARASTARLGISELSVLPVPLQKYLSSLRAREGMSQDCMAYSLAYEYALRLQPSRAPLLSVYDALKLGPSCGVPPPPVNPIGLPAAWPPAAGAPRVSTATDAVFYVSPTGSDANPGTASSPFLTVAKGVEATRASRPAPGLGSPTLYLRAGMHLLGNTIDLDAGDSGLFISNAPGEVAWVSGGLPVTGLEWRAINTTNSSNIFSAHVPNPPTFMTGLFTVSSKDGVSPSKRLIRAQYPNFNPEWHATGACGMGGRQSPLHMPPECQQLYRDSPFLQHFAGLYRDSGDATSEVQVAGGVPLKGGPVLEWNKPPSLFPRPATFWHDLEGEGLKNDSAMWQYNAYSAGRGGACGLWTDAWPEDHSYGWDYHCGNVSAGGWEEVDELMNSIGQLNIPVGLTYDSTKLPNIPQWSLNTDPSQRVNGASILNVWMTQGWFNNFMYVTGAHTVNSSAGFLNLSADGVYPAGGWQGGRHWQTQDSFSTGGHVGPLLGGSWSVSNVFSELDSYDEFYYDPSTSMLHLNFNSSETESGNPNLPPTPSLLLMAPQLEVFFNLSNGATGISISGLGFRDQRFSYMDPWVVPSGGDWGLRPAGAVNFVDTINCTLSNAYFLRTDANAVFLGGRNRGASILDSEFVWLGMNAVASLGWSEQDDATGGEQPWGTLLSGLLVHEIALYEKQSSAYFSGRTPLARIENCLFFNGPRAFININDGLGGGSNFTTSLLFNTCRESGDHGALNSWDRMPFLTNIAGNGPSYSPALTETSKIFGIANYGSSQAFDNDDGSSFYYTHSNFFYNADGFKMDFGGHDSIFASNVVIVRPFDGQNCFNMWGFVPGHQDKLYNNTCSIWQPGVSGNPRDADMVLTQNDCGACNVKDRSATPIFHDNHFYTTHGNASVNCGGEWGTTVADMQKKFPDFEVRSTWETLPDAATVVQWGRDVLGL